MRNAIGMQLFGFVIATLIAVLIMVVRTEIVVQQDLGNTSEVTMLNGVAIIAAIAGAGVVFVTSWVASGGDINDVGNF